MRSWKLAALFTAIPVVGGLTLVIGRAETAEVLKEITDTADRLCGNVAQSGNKSSTEVKGDVKAELSGLAKRLANLGVSGSGTIDESQYEGVVQEQLAETLKDVRQCKITIFETLQKKLLAEPPQQHARDPNALYQYGELVAEVQGAVISQANGTVTFQTVHTSGKADSTHEVEYQNWVLSCPDLPAPCPNTMVGQFSGMVVGEKCAIVRKLH